MDKAEEYRAHAAQCQRMADSSKVADQARQWRSLAQTWLGLIPPSQRTPAEDHRAEQQVFAEPSRPRAVASESPEGSSQRGLSCE
jgi:hypothetical protein